MCVLASVIQVKNINQPKRGLNKFVDSQCWLVLRSRHSDRFPVMSSWFSSQLLSLQRWSLQTLFVCGFCVFFSMGSAKL